MNINKMEPSSPEAEPTLDSLQEFANLIGLNDNKVEEIKGMTSSMIIEIPQEHRIPYSRGEAVKIIIDHESGERYRITGEPKSMEGVQMAKIERY